MKSMLMLSLRGESYSYNILVVSGGNGPEKMKLEKDALEITRHFFKENKQLMQSVMIPRF